MEHYAGLDVSLELTSVCLVNASGQVVREAKVESKPDALIHFSLRSVFTGMALKASRTCRVSNSSTASPAAFRPA